MNGSIDYAIAARDVGIKYDLRLKRRRTFQHTLAQVLRGDASTIGRDEFWALQGVTFALRRGEVLAVVGNNGAGKSTLLETVAGVLRPDAGAITTYGHSATLLTLGKGFELDLSGRENIYLNAAYLGFRTDQIDAHLREIIEFAELGEFIEAPIATYSTGMRARLGFSIAAHLEPEILLLDEVLGVGDAGFQRKSQEKLEELIDRAEAIVVVSHSEAFISRMATRVLWLDGGRVRRYGDTDEVLEEYLEASERFDHPKRETVRDPGIAEPVSAQEITVTRVLDAPRERVWRAWTEPEQLARWWSPRGWTVPLETITMDVRPGGAFRVTLVNDENGSEVPRELVYRQVVEPERLVKGPADEAQPGSPVSAVTFTDLGDGRTELNLHTTVQTTDEMRDAAEAAVASLLDRLAEQLPEEALQGTSDWRGPGSLSGVN